jgi:hypothetical protein
MAQIDTANSSFIRYTLTEDELTVGSILTTLHKQCIQNQIAEAAEQRISIRMDPQNPLQSLQEDAELQGRILALKYLIQLSDSAELQLKQAATNSQG